MEREGARRCRDPAIVGSQRCEEIRSDQAGHDQHGDQPGDEPKAATARVVNIHGWSAASRRSRARRTPDAAQPGIEIRSRVCGNRGAGRALDPSPPKYQTRGCPSGPSGSVPSRTGLVESGHDRTNRGPRRRRARRRRPRRPAAEPRLRRGRPARRHLRHEPGDARPDRRRRDAVHGDRRRRAASTRSCRPAGSRSARTAR